MNKISKKFSKKENFCKLRFKHARFASKNAFSIAEALVMLLIVSVAMALSAPIFSKRAVVSSGNADSVPKGAVMFFNAAETTPPNRCPNGWVNVARENSDWAGRFIKISPEDVNLYGRTEEQSITLPPHYHGIGNFGGSSSNKFLINREWNIGADINMYFGSGHGDVGHGLHRAIAGDAGTTDAIINETGAPAEVTPSNVSLMMCQKN